MTNVRISTTARVAGTAAALVMGAVFAAHATPPRHEGLLVSPADALAYCQSGQQKAGTVAYINGTGGVAQFGPGAGCAQKVPAFHVKAALVYKGTKVVVCQMADAAAATSFCNSGKMGTYDIDYIHGKAGLTISGPGYGCPVGSSTSGIGNALCQ